MSNEALEKPVKANWAPDGAFLPGHSIKSPGRTPIAQGGKPNPASIVKNAIADQAIDIINMVIKKALEGDLVAAKLVIERISPSLRSIEHAGLDGSTLPRMEVRNRGEVIDVDMKGLAQDVKELDDQAPRKPNPQPE